MVIALSVFYAFLLATCGLLVCLLLLVSGTRATARTQQPFSGADDAGIC